MVTWTPIRTMSKASLISFSCLKRTGARMTRQFTQSPKKQLSSFVRFDHRKLAALTFIVITCLYYEAAISSIPSTLVESSSDGFYKSMQPVPIQCDDFKVSSSRSFDEIRNSWTEATSESSIIQRTENCQEYFGIYYDLIKPKILLQNLPTFEKHFNYGASDEKSGSPVRLAFSILIHDKMSVFESLLHTIFKPQHSYCIHIDLKAPKEAREGAQNIIKCFQERFPETQIFLADFEIPVYWGHVSMLEAELHCLELLLNRGSNWDYYLNLAGSELPLVPMDTIERQVAKLGKNDSVIESYAMPENQLKRYKFAYALGDKEAVRTKWSRVKYSLDIFGVLYDSHSYRFVPLKTDKIKSPPPFNLTIYKGQKNVILSRTFAEFVLTNEVARTLRKWMEDMLIPDESFYATLSRITDIQINPEIDGNGQTETYLKRMEKKYRVFQLNDGQHQKDVFHGFCIRRSMWSYFGCKGMLKREICNLSMQDLPVAVNSICEHRIAPCLFLNKLDPEVDPLPIKCLIQHALTYDEKMEHCINN